MPQTLQTTQLTGETVFFVRVAPGYVSEALGKFQTQPNVTNAYPTLGAYDILVSGRWPDFHALSAFRAYVESQSWTRACDVSPGITSWYRENAPTKGYPLSGWSLIWTANPGETIRHLQNIPNVNGIHTTIGEYNLIVQFYVNDPSELMTTVTDHFHNYKEIKRTETFVSFPNSKS